MKTSNYNKSAIMKRSWSLSRVFRNKSFSYCLTIAWREAKEDVARNARYSSVTTTSIGINTITPSMASLYASGAYSGD